MLVARGTCPPNQHHSYRPAFVKPKLTHNNNRATGDGRRDSIYLGLTLQAVEYRASVILGYLKFYLKNYK